MSPHDTAELPVNAAPRVHTERRPVVARSPERILRISSIKPYTRDGINLFAQLPISELEGRGWTVRWNEEIDACDAWLILDGVGEVEACRCPRENVLFMTAEPSAYKRYPKVWLEQFPNIVTWQRRMQHARRTHGHVPLPWFIGRSRAELLAMHTTPKSRDISGFCSSQHCMKGHHRRLSCVGRLKRDMGDDIDWFGRNIRFIEDKWDGLAPYRFSFALENSREDDYWTEKLVDCFLSRTIPLYDGAPNLAQYFPEGSYIPVNMDDHGAIVQLVSRLLRDPIGEYQRRQAALEQARTLCLERYSLGARLLEWCDTLSVGLPAPIHHFVPEPKLPWFERKVMQFRRRWLGRL